MTFTSAVSHTEQANSHFLSGMFYPAKCNERACIVAKAKLLSCPPQLGLGSGRALGKHCWVSGLQEAAGGAGCQAWALLECLALAGTSSSPCLQSTPLAGLSISTSSRQLANA